jgi:hypothetical protein
MNIMIRSIQDYVKKINSQISKGDCISLFLTTLVLGAGALYFTIENGRGSVPVSYIEGNSTSKPLKQADSRPFASIHGKTYTFNWCQGATQVLEKNRVYFNTETQAVTSGRTLSKLCSK